MVIIWIYNTTLWRGEQEQTITQKMADQGRSDFMYHESLRTWIKTIVNKFATSNHTALILGVHALRSYLKLICEYELHSLPNTKFSGAKDHGRNYNKFGPPLVLHLLRNRLLCLKFICECQKMTSIAYQKKLVAQRGKNYIKVKPPLARHLLRNPLNFTDIFLSGLLFRMFISFT